MITFEELWAIAEEELASRRNEDYELNTEQKRKFSDSFEFFVNAAQKCGGKIEKPKMVPREKNGYITAYFPVFSLRGEEMKRFAELCGDFSAMSIDSLEDGTVCLSFVIPDVFRKKTK